MSLKDDLKRIFFGAKAVAKSAADKATEAAREAGEDLNETGSELFDKASRKASELGEDLLENTAEARAKAKETLSDVSDRVWEETQHAMEKGRELKGKAEDWLADKKPADTVPLSDEMDDFVSDDDPVNFHTKETPDPRPAAEPIDFEADVEEPAVPKEPSAFAKAADQGLNTAARTGAKAMGAANEAGKKVMHVSEDIGEKVLDAGSKVFGKAKELGGDLANKAADMVERAQDEIDRDSLKSAEEKAEELARQAQARADSAVKDTKESLLDGKDDFFARAERYAQGDYKNEGGKKMTIGTNPDHVPPTPSGKAAGFEDLDGDGDELIDDAIIDED